MPAQGLFGKQSPLDLSAGRDSFASRSLQVLVVVILASLATVAFRYLFRSGATPLDQVWVFSFSVIGVWRWGWGALHILRATWYRYVMFPRIRRDVELRAAAAGGVPELAVVATTYHEHAWITEIVVRSLVREFRRLALHPTAGLVRPVNLVFVTGGADDDAAVTRIFQEALDAIESAEPTSNWPPQLTLLRGEQGKRPAIAAGLKYLATLELSPRGVVVLMDGDTALEPGALERSLPVFRYSEQLGAVTTNERAVLQAPGWFAEWIKLRFGQRHLYMCSLAMSRKLLCLTGRLSLFRADLATEPSFIAQIEHDELEHWLYGRYQMFSGDDKSTWFWMNAHGYDLLYVPDAHVVTYEVVTSRPGQRVVANLKRWSGNMLRNSGRAMALGPRRLRLFPWLCVVDQLASMWTALIGPVAMLMALWAQKYEFVAAYGLWLLGTRTVRVMCGWLHGRRISPIFIPLQLMSEWVGAVVKIWVYFHPVKQTWLNRGNRTLDSSAQGSLRRVRAGLANYYYGISFLTFVVMVGSYIGVVPLLRDVPLMLAGLGLVD